MQISNKTTNIISTVIAVTLAVFLTIFLISSPIFSGVSEFREPEKIAEIASGIDAERLLVSSEEISDAAEEVGLTEMSVQKILKSGAVHEILTLYAADFLNAIKGNETAKNLTAEKIPEIAERNIDELSAIIRESVPNAQSLTDDELKSEIIGTASKYSKRIISALPSFQQIEEISKEPEFHSAVDLIKSDDYLTSLITLIVFLSVAILLIKIKGFQSLMILGAAYLISSFAVLIAALSDIAETVLDNMLIFLPLGSIFNAPLVDFVSETLYRGFIILFIIGLVLLGGYFAIKYFKNKKEKVI